MTRLRNVTYVSSAVVAVASILTSGGCNWLKSRDHLNQGVAAYRNAKYGDAVEHFKQAIELDPTNTNPRVYLATSYMQQWIPGADSPENQEMARHAREEFMKVLEKDPNEKTALNYLASLSYNEASSLSIEKKKEKLDEAAAWYHKLLAVDPNNKEAYYTLGVIAWAKWYPALQLALLNLHMRPEDPGPIKDKKVKDELRTQYAAVVDEGIQNLNKALEIDKEYDDAMSYLNLLIRERADLVDTSDEYKKQIEVAEGWIQKALETRKVKLARQPSTGGIVAETK
jgi:tetratricopeptide (TPR) repeat protein